MGNLNRTELYQIRDRVARLGQPVYPLTPLGSLELIDQLLNTMKERDEACASLDALKKSPYSNEIGAVRAALDCKPGESLIERAKKVQAESTGLYEHKMRVRKALGIDAGVGCVAAIKKLKERAEAPRPKVLRTEQEYTYYCTHEDAAKILGTKSDYLLRRCREVMAELNDYKARLDAKCKELNEERTKNTARDYDGQVCTVYALHLLNEVLGGTPNHLRGLAGRKFWDAALNYLKTSREPFGPEHRDRTFNDFCIGLSSAIGGKPKSTQGMSGVDTWAALLDHVKRAFNTAHNVQEELKEAQVTISTLSRRFEVERQAHDRCKLDLASMPVWAELTGTKAACEYLRACLDEQKKINANAHKELALSKKMLTEQEDLYIDFAKQMFGLLDVANNELYRLKGIKHVKYQWIEPPKFGWRSF